MGDVGKEGGGARKPKLLFLAHGFPPKIAIGCVRTHSMARWLTRKGWEVIVVTPRESIWGRNGDESELHRKLLREGIRCIRTDHRWKSLLAGGPERREFGFRRIAGGLVRHGAELLRIEREAGWVRDAERACAGLVRDDVDLVLASGPPFVSFSLARRLGARLGCPYVLDYRDLWTRNPHAFRVAPRRLVDRERIAVESSAATIGVSPSLIQSVRQEFRPARACVISNGFDPDELATVPKHAFGHFAIVYAGTFYPPKRGVEPLMSALQKLDAVTSRADGWAFHYYGSRGDYVQRAADEFRVSHRVRIEGRVSRQEALSAVRGASIAVVITSVYEHASLAEKGIVTGKVFEAIGLGAPLLVIAPEGSDLDGILETTGLGKRFAGTEIGGIVEFLGERMSGVPPEPRNITMYSWANIGDQLDSVLRDCLARS
jgi:glycosyltransferase involved in cell wall biosynthesis